MSGSTFIPGHSGLRRLANILLMKHHSRNIFGRPHLFGFLMVCTVMAASHEGATGIVKERMDLMSDMGDAMKTLAGMVKGEQPLNLESVRQSIDTIADHAGQMLDLFPNTQESRSGKGTEALPEIWENWDRFTGLSRDLEQEISEISKLADNTMDDATLKVSFRKLAKACFRLPRRLPQARRMRVSRTRQ